MIRRESSRDRRVESFGPEAKGMAMDRGRAFEPEETETGYDPSAEGYLLPSRSAAFQASRAALAFGAGPLLVSGEAGVGKTWLGRRLAAGLPAELRAVAIDATPTTGPERLFRALAGSLGLAGNDPRQSVQDYLAERAFDGRRWLLVVDEAHVLADAVLDELRILSNRLGQADGLGGLVLVGQSCLVRRLSGRGLKALGNRL